MSVDVLHHDIDSDGDVYLNLSSDPDITQRLVRVSSKVLCLASPVFKAMLGSSSFKEAEKLRSGTPALIPLIGDNEDALLVVLNAAHLCTQLIPCNVSLDLLYEIAVVCDKYDMARVLLPWPIIWTAGFDGINCDAGDKRWLVISWVFKQSRIFTIITRALILNTELDDEDRLVLSGNCIESGIVPSRVTGQYSPPPLSYRRGF